MRFETYVTSEHYVNKYVWDNKHLLFKLTEHTQMALNVQVILYSKILCLSYKNNTLLNSNGHAQVFLFTFSSQRTDTF